MADSLAGVRVLLVEDDEDNRDLFTYALGRAGAEVRAVRDAGEALRAVVAWSPGVIITDLVMPDVDGFSLLREIRSQHRLENIPAIAFTGRASKTDREACLAGGFQEHVPKPADPAHVIAIVARWASGAKDAKPAT